jgi:hypothetical protein
VLAAAAGTGTAALAASPSGNKVKAGDLLVSGTIFQQPDIVAGQTQLPPGCAAANCVTAAADGTYPQVFNSGGGDQGADPNKVVEITDNLAATSQPAGETFQTVRTAVPGELFRGVSFAPGT